MTETVQCFIWECQQPNGC